MMRIFKRVKNIIDANLNDKLEKMENPEKMIRLMLAQIDTTLIEAKRGAAERLANRSIVEQELKKTKEALKRWEKRALLAVEKNLDDMAREALIEKQRLEKEIVRFEAEFAQMQDIVNSIQAQIALLEAKKQEVVEKQRLLIQRAYHAKEKKKVAQMLRDLEADVTLRRFEELESQIERLEAEAKVYSGETKSAQREKTFAKMEVDEAIEAELAKLKKGKKES
jgi:phage shock protein A